MQFREKMLSYSKAAAVAVFLTVFAVYTVLSYAVYRAANMRGIHVNWYGVIDGLQEVYLLVGEKTGWMAGKMSAACRGKIRTGLFLFLILYMQAVQNLQKYENDRYFKIQMLVCGLVVFLIGVLCFEGTLQKRSWRNKLAGGWTVLWIMACVSDFFVGKRYMFLGYLMLSAVGFFIFMWNNMKDEMMILREMNAAILISFAVTSVFCFLCRPLVPGYRYLGSYYNPGMYAMYVLYVWIALWADLDFKMNHKRKLFPAVLPDLFGIALAGLFIWKTQSSSGVIPAALTVGIFLFKQFFLSHSRKLRKKTGIVLAAGIVLAVPVCMAGQWGLTHLPEMLNTQVQFPNDALGAAEDIRLPFEPVTVYAAENAEDTKKAPEHHVLEKFTWNQSLEEFTTGRNLYWMGYLREMNLIGNENKVYLWGKNRWPHNGFIVIMFRYGVFAVIPYTLMVVMNLYYSWKYMLSHKKTYGFFVFASMAASLILILMENLELPFLFLCWIVMYLTMGVNFVQEET